MGSQERFHRYQGRNLESFVIRCLWMLMFLIANTFATEFIPVSRCPDVSPDTSLEQASGFVCSDVKDQLHCILEEDNYKLGLVCAPWAWMDTNTCPIFSFSQNGIKFNSCSGNNTLCPSSVSAYKSFEAYKYPGCFIGKDMLTATKATTQTTTTKETTQATTTTKTESEGSDTKYLHLGLTRAPSVTTNPDSVTMSEINRSPDLPEYVLIILLVMSVMLNVILIVIFQKPIKRWLKRSNDKEDPNDSESKKETSDKDPKNGTKINSEHQKHMADTDSGSVGKCDVDKQVEENEGADSPLIGRETDTPESIIKMYC